MREARERKRPGPDSAARMAWLLTSAQFCCCWVNITFPFMDFASIHAREAAQASTLAGARANEQLADRTLQEQFSQAAAALRATRTSRRTLRSRCRRHNKLFQANARYKAGLSPIDVLPRPSGSWCRHKSTTPSRGSMLARFSPSAGCSGRPAAFLEGGELTCD